MWRATVKASLLRHASLLYTRAHAEMLCYEVPRTRLTRKISLVNIARGYLNQETHPSLSENLKVNRWKNG